MSDEVAAQDLAAASPDFTIEPPRPRGFLSRSQLLSVSVYWLGVSLVWGGWEIFGQQRIQDLVGVDSRGTTQALLELVGGLVAIVVQPTIGTISDYTTTRWGRRKPYILVGGALDLLFLYAIANSQSLLALAVFFLLLQVSANFAQGPYQGYVPDLVPERQVNVASGLMGFMRLGGLVAGAGIIASGFVTHDFSVPLVLLGVFEFGLAVATLVFVHEGPTARPRNGRSWMSIATEAWGMDVLRERSFLFMMATRLLFMMGPAIFANVSSYYVTDTLGLVEQDATLWLTVGLATIGIGGVVGTVPSARLADRVGRKPVIWSAALIVATGILLVARAPNVYEALPGLFMMGLGNGLYMAIDWALMTSTIPKIASGRYMGLANIANSLSGPLALALGGVVLDLVTRAGDLAAAPRAAILTGIIFVALASVMLTFVRPRSQRAEPETIFLAEAGA